MDQRDHQPTPELIFATFNAYQRSAALKGAIELDLFTAISEGARTAQALAERCQASARGVRILCDFLVVHGLLLKEEDRYSLAPDSAAFLDRRSPAYLGGAVNFLASPVVTGVFDDLAAAVRRGGTATGEGEVLSPEHPVWVDFARSMAAIAAPAAEAVAKLLDAGHSGNWKVLDIAAGHGLFGIAIARRNPGAEVVAQDWANVLAVAQENAQAAGLAERYRTLPGSALDVDFGGGYDVVLITNFFHHFGVAACRNVMAKVHRALKDGGRAVTVEFIPNEDRVTPSVAAAFSLTMLAATPAGDAYTFSQYDAMFREAGFSRNELHPLPMSPQRVIVSYKQ